MPRGIYFNVVSVSLISFRIMSQKTSTKRGRQSRPVSDEEIMELFLGPCSGGQCPNCQLYVTEEFYVKDYSKKLFACRNCKAQFIGVTSYPYNRRTKWIPYSSSLIGPKEHVQGNPLN